MDNEKELSLASAPSETAKVALESAEEIAAPSHKKTPRIRRDATSSRKRDEGDGARHIPHYVDQHEDYVPVSRPLLRELSSFGWLQEGSQQERFSFRAHFGCSLLCCLNIAMNIRNMCRGL
jgi:hypothetical protein